MFQVTVQIKSSNGTYTIPIKLRAKTSMLLANNQARKIRKEGVEYRTKGGGYAHYPAASIWAAVVNKT